MGVATVAKTCLLVLSLTSVRVIVHVLRPVYCLHLYDLLWVVVAWEVLLLPLVP